MTGLRIPREMVVVMVGEYSLNIESAKSYRIVFAMPFPFIAGSRSSSVRTRMKSWIKLSLIVLNHHPLTMTTILSHQLLIIRIDAGM